MCRARLPAPAPRHAVGFALAIKQLGSKLGGQPAEFVQTDMAGAAPTEAKQLVDRFVQARKDRPVDRPHPPATWPWP